MRRKDTSIEITPIDRTPTLDSLVSAGVLDYVPIDDTDYSTPEGAVPTELPNGEPALVMGICHPPDHGSGDSVSVRSLDGEILGNIYEPELQGRSVHVRVARDEDSLYIATSNTTNPIIARYSLEDFSRIWKVSPFNRDDSNYVSTQSLDADGEYVLTFNMSCGKIEFYDKETGSFVKEIDTKKEIGGRTWTTNHNLASCDGNIMASTPRATLGGLFGLPDLPNAIELYDASGQLVARKEVDFEAGIFKGIAVDRTNKRAYLGAGNAVLVYDRDGFQGGFITPNNGQVMALNVDQQTGELLVSSGGTLDRDSGVSKITPYGVDQLMRSYRLEATSAPRKLTG